MSDLIIADVAGLLGGVVSGLERHVRPMVEHQFAALQLDSSIVLLRTISAEVDWHQSDVQAAFDRTESVARELERLRGEAPTDTTSAGDLTAARARLSQLIGGLYQQDSSDGVAVLTRALRAQYDI